jgi:hypothetical protein
MELQRLLFICVLKLLRSAFIFHDNIVQEFITVMFMVQQGKLLANICLLFQVGSEHSRPPTHIHLSVTQLCSCCFQVLV